MPITRQVKNVVKNYSNVEVKVREATSNDPWGPSSSLMADIADQTYNVVAFSEIMTMIWKRLNDHGKNWRHVYKSLVLLDYILKTGSERVAHQCRENIFSVQTLKDFQFIDRDGKDQGMNVREKSKQLVALLKDEERLKNERTRALKAKERLSQSSGGVGNSTKKSSLGGSLRESGSASDVRVERASEATEPTSRSWEPERRNYQSEIEKCRPSNSNEEELQLQLALALSKQEADETKQSMDKDEQRFQMAVTESRQSVKKTSENSLLNIAGSGRTTGDPWAGTSTVAQPSVEPWGRQPADPWGSSTSTQPTVQADPWANTAPQSNASWSGGIVGSTQIPPADPWGTGTSQALADPWGGTSAPSSQPDPWAGTSAPVKDPWQQPTTTTAVSNDLFATPADPWSGSHQVTSNGGTSVSQSFNIGGMAESPKQGSQPKQTDLLADHSTLVNLDSLVSTDKQSNPFFSPVPQPTKPGNPFAQEKPVAPSLNQLRTTIPQPTQTNQAPFGDPLLPAPLIPTGSSGGAAAAPNNPFL